MRVKGARRPLPAGQRYNQRAAAPFPWVGTMVVLLIVTIALGIGMQGFLTFT